MIETQYKDLFVRYREMIDEKSAAGLNKLRDKAVEIFNKQGFPTNKLEEDQHINVAAEFIPDYGLNLNRLPFQGNPYLDFRCDVHNLSTQVHYVVNDMYQDKVPASITYPEGVFVGSLKEFAEKYPTVFSKYYGQIADMEKPGIVAFNTMFVQDGFVVYVPKGLVLEKPIQLINILRCTVAFLVTRRVLIIAEVNA